MIRIFLVLVLLSGPVFADARSSAKFVGALKITKQPGPVGRNCGRNGWVEQILSKKYGEEMMLRRHGPKGVAYEHWEGRNTWTITRTFQDTTCVLASGKFNRNQEQL